MLGLATPARVCHNCPVAPTSEMKMGQIPAAALACASALTGLAVLALLGPWPLLALLLVIGLVGIYTRLYIKDPPGALLLLIGLATFESITFMAMSRALHLPAHAINALLSAKFVLLGTAVVAGIFFGRRQKETAPDVAAYVLMAYGIIVLAALFQQNLKHYSTMPQVRAFFSYITPVLLYSAARFSNMTAVQLQRVIRGCIVIAILAGVFGLIERLLLPISFWNTLGLPAFLAAKGAIPTLLHEGSESILGSAFSRRLIGPFDYPLNAAYFFIVPISLLMTMNVSGRFKRYGPALALGTLLLSCAELLTLTRGAIVGLLISIALMTIVSRRGRRFAPALIVALLLLAVSPLGYNLVAATVSLSDPSARNHMVVIGSDLRNAFNSFFGNGFGTAGFAAIEANGYASVGENLFATIGDQCGIAGIALFLLFVFAIVQYATRRASGRLMHCAQTALLVSTIAFMIGSFTTEHWQALESADMYWILAGAVVGMRSAKIDLENTQERVAQKQWQTI